MNMMGENARASTRSHLCIFFLVAFSHFSFASFELCSLLSDFSFAYTGQDDNKPSLKQGLKPESNIKPFNCLLAYVNVKTPIDYKGHCTESCFLCYVIRSLMSI